MFNFKRKNNCSQIANLSSHSAVGISPLWQFLTCRIRYNVFQFCLSNGRHTISKKVLIQPAELGGLK